MVLRLLRIAAAMAMLLSPVGAAGEVNRHYRVGDFEDDPTRVALDVAVNSVPAGCLFCIAAILYVLSDGSIRKQESRDPERASYRDDLPPGRKT